jgi:hypothetical protein
MAWFRSDQRIVQPLPRLLIEVRLHAIEVALVAFSLMPRLVE